MLAVLLAFALIAGSTTVAMAEFFEGDGTATLRTVWKVYDPETDSFVDLEEGDTEHAGPGDYVRADIIISTDFKAGSMSFNFYYPDGVMELDTSRHRVSIPGTPPFYAIVSESGMGGDFVTCKPGINQMIIDECLEPGCFDGYDGQFILCTNFVEQVYDNVNAFTMYFKIKDDVAFDAQQWIKVFPGTTSTSSLGEDAFYVNGNICWIDPNDGEQVTSEFYNLMLDVSSETLVFSGDINLNTAPYGTIGEPATTTATIQDYYGTDLEEADLPAVTVADGYKFIGWSTDAYTGTEGQTDGDGKAVFGGDYSKLITDYSEIKYKGADRADTLYGVYGYADTTYIYNIYEQDLEGNYPAVPSYTSDPINATVGDVINASDIDTSSYTGFVNDSTASITLVSDVNDNVLDVYLSRAKYNITWKVGEDTVAGPTEITYGQPLGRIADPDYVVTDVNDDNYGKYVSEWSDHDFNCTGDVTVLGTLSDIDVRVIYSADDGDGHVGTFDGASDVTKAYGSSIGSADFGTLTPPTGYHQTGVTYKDAAGSDQTVTDIGAIPAALTKDNYQLGTIDTATGAVPTAVITLTPVYEINSGSVTFNANGGYFTADPAVDVITDTYTYGATVTIPGAEDIEVPKTETDASGVSSYYDFAGWATASDATAPGDVEGTYVEDATYFAVWQDNRVTITYKDKEDNDLLVLKRNLGNEGSYTLVDGTDYPAANAVPTAEGEEWVWDIASTTITGDVTYRGHSIYDLQFKYTDIYGTEVSSDVSKLQAGENLPAYPVIDIEGYDFAGWYTDAACTELFANAGSIAASQMPAAALTLYGKYVAHQHTVTYKVDGEVYGEVETLDYDAPIILRDVPPARDGYTFSGWQPSVPATIPVTMPDSDVEITGSFSANTYTIVYLNGEEEVAVISQAYESAIDPAREPDGDALSTPEKTFTGWSESLPATMPIYTETVGTHENNAHAIYALFDDVDQVTVTYQHADGSTEELTGYPGTALTAPALAGDDIRDGYDSDWSQDLNRFPTADTTVTVDFTPKDVTVRLDPANGDPVSDQTVAYDGTVTEPATEPTSDAGDFDGWYLPDGTKFDFTAPIEDQTPYGTGELNLKARYSITDTYLIPAGTATTEDGIVFTDYGPLVSFKHFTDETDETYEVPSIPEMEGFTGTYWSLTETGDDAAPDGNWSTASRDFYAQYEINKHTVTYVVDGETYEVYLDVPFASELPRPATDPAKDDYVFAGWLDADGKAPGNYDSMPDKDLTFTAQFVVPGADYTITYYDREGNVYQTYTVHSGDPITDEYIPEDPTRFGMVFKGWEPEIPAVMPEENLEFTAVWGVDPTFVGVVIGGTVVSGAVIGTAAAANAALITGGVIVGGALVVGGIALAKHTHKVTYIVDGNVYRVYYILEGAKVIVPKDPSKDGADFTGWTPDIPERMPENDLTFTATWSTDKAPVDSVIPDTGSAAASLAAFAVISSAAAAAYVITRKKKENED